MKELIKKLLSRFGIYTIKGYKNYFFTNNKIVTREIYGRKVSMPKSHSIMYNLSHFPYYNSNLQRLVQQYDRHRGGGFSIIDVGSNIGDTLLMLRQVTDLPIHCFEGDPFFSALLETNSAGIAQQFIHKTLLSDKPGNIKVKSLTDHGTSKFVSDSAGGERLEFSSIDHFFGRQFPDEVIGVIKTDTDGYDLKILKGAADTIKKYQPVIFLEYDRKLFEKNGDDGPAFFDFLRSLDYDGLLVYDNFGKLVCITSLKDQLAVRSLHSYINDQKGAFPFFDLALFSVRDAAFYRSFSDNELVIFEQKG
jgi:FkbM family methyltransferase